MMHQLESRQLLSASLAGGILTVEGTRRSDVIELDLRSATQLKVEINGAESRFDYSKITKIVVNSGLGNDIIEFNQRNPILVGTDISSGGGNDIVEGTAGRDTIRGGDGNDFLDGREGDDSILGEAGNDKLEGKEGNDFLSGGLGNDFLQAHSGNDSLFGNEGHDDLNSGAGDDSVFGGLGNDDFARDDRGQIKDETGDDKGLNVLVGL